MPLPPDAVLYPQRLDPSDIIEFKASIAQGPADLNPTPMLLTGEKVANLGVALTSEAAAAGLSILSASPYPPPSIDTDNIVTIWLTVDTARRGDAIFNNLGVTVGIEITLVTTNSPPRQRQRTVGLRIAQA